MLRFAVVVLFVATFAMTAVLATEPAAGGDRVLRHVVLVKFKDTVTPEKVKKLEEAFCGLADKIDTIVDFEWGTDVSVEGHDQGFTHCFRVTFKDEKGRADYLPHPEHKKLVDLVVPNIEKVLVVDYWADLTEAAIAQQKDPKRVLRHVVLFKYKDDSGEDDIAGVMNRFKALPGKADMIHDFECGKDVSVEGRAEGFQHCFVVTFKDEAGRAAYLPHPEHKKFVDKLLPHLDKVLVVDYFAQK